MTSNAATWQPGLFGLGVIPTIRNVLMSHQQPSANELINICTKELGSEIREEIKGAVLDLLNDKSLPSHHKPYLQNLLDDGSLDRAIAGEFECQNRREIETGIDLLLSSGIAYRNSDAFRELITFMGMFRDYSPYNNMLVYTQNRSCCYYATKKDWASRFGRRIKEDARPMLILAPMHPLILVYDIDQTEGNDLPVSYKDFAKFEGEWDENSIERLTENAKRYKIRIDYKTLTSANAGFATYPSYDDQWKMRIAIHEELDAPSRFGVLCHEIAHILLGHLGGDKDSWWPSRMNLDHHSEEIEAEATAFIVSSQLGLRGSSDEYVSSHLQNGESVPQGVSIDNIARVSSKILQMSKALMSAPKPKKEKVEKRKRVPRRHN